MKTIALNIASPIQSWADESISKMRVDTLAKPTTRAIRGLLSAAFGVGRHEEQPNAIKKAKIEVIVNQKGRVIKDFQTTSSQDSERAGAKPHDEAYFFRVGRIFKKNHAKPDEILQKQSIIERTYLADAGFLVLISGETIEDTELILKHLENPKWDLYFGRKAFPPVFPFILGLFEETSGKEEALRRLDEIEKSRAKGVRK